MKGASVDQTIVNTDIVDEVVALCRRAGEAILEVYARSDLGVEVKSDESPLTAADLAAHHILVGGLEGLLEGVPVLSEEAAAPPFSERIQWQRYWIIDPLDGTKEFIKRSGEFTVNVALVDNHVPVLGVVHVPVSGVTYTGLSGSGAYKMEGEQPGQAISVRTMSGRGGTDNPVTVVASRSHGAGAVDDLLRRLAKDLGETDTCNMGSSLKLCLVAEGSADIYPRLAPTMEWDTAAAQAVVEAAGGQVLNFDLEPLRYNRKDELLNPYFYVLGDSSFPWKNLLSGIEVES
ncbi:3'(2'),5'-bisphosphate nucleotidase [Gammaproteobacteria bacterium 54_18_T64]|nr:3'(2'),5'-bisphosphate nucleotidase [Gammaproteobacteria bacterium 54_18_T64]